MPKGSENVTVQRAGKTRTGDVTPGVVVGMLRRCIVIPRASSERADRGIVSIEGFTVWAPMPQPKTDWPADAELKSTDYIIVRGEEHQIEGSPSDWQKKGREVWLSFQTKRYGT